MLVKGLTNPRGDMQSVPARSTGWGGGDCSCEEGIRWINVLSSFYAFLLPSCTIHDKNGSNLISKIHVFIRQNKCAITQSFVPKQSCSWLALFLTRVYLFLNNSTFRDLLCIPPLNSWGTFGQLPDRAKTWVRHPGLGHQLPCHPTLNPGTRNDKRANESLCNKTPKKKHKGTLYPCYVVITGSVH